MANDKIIIDLSKSLNARSFEGTDIIHKTEFDRVKKLIDDKIKDITRFDLKGGYPYAHYRFATAKCKKQSKRRRVGGNQPRCR